jgi:hypothetical protein
MAELGDLGHLDFSLCLGLSCVWNLFCDLVFEALIIVRKKTSGARWPNAMAVKDGNSVWQDPTPAISRTRLRRSRGYSSTSAMKFVIGLYPLLLIVKKLGLWIFAYSMEQGRLISYIWWHCWVSLAWVKAQSAPKKNVFEPSAKCNQLLAIVLVLVISFFLIFPHL